MSDMTMRDQFAMAALTGLLSASSVTTSAACGHDKFAVAAYRYAHAMMKARQAQGEGK